MDILVIGCGVSGLSCGIRLLEAGFTVQIWARDLAPRTTSNVAAARWYSFKGFPGRLVVGWSAGPVADFGPLADVPEAGITQRTGIEIFPWPVEDPWWRAAVPGFRRATAGELPIGSQD